jgi:hypothetical protein
MKPQVGVKSKFNSVIENEGFSEDKEHIKHEFAMIKHKQKLEKID